MSSVDQYNLTTVINKEDFKNTVEVKECPTVGRSLVVKRPLVPGDVVLVEEPLIQYDLKPCCRSNKSPYFSKKLWESLIATVQEYEEPVEQETEDLKEEKEEKDEDDSYDGYSSEEDSDEEEEEEVNTDSDFCPGVPAAILAYLNIHPPTNAYNQVRRRNSFKQDDFDFFYYPDAENWLEHKTVELIHKVCQKVAKTESLFAHVDPVDLSSFVLKIYSNAHTVSLPRARDTPTHAHRKYRRDFYKDKFEDNDTCWGEDAVEPPNTPTIALLRWGSKFAHSCSPNMFLRFEPARNAMVFTVVRPLAVGDILSFSYLPEDDLTVGGLICGTTVDRQAKLEKFKFFTCACERCLDWDWSRGVTCQNCQQPELYYRQGSWTCFSCDGHEPTSFIGDKEKSVQRMIMGFASRVYGNRRMNQAMMRMLEPYLTNLLEPNDGQEAVPKNHWTYSMIHSLLATYHLTLFPQSFGKGLASQLGLLQKGLEEALAYLEFLNTSIRTHGNEKSTAKGNPMAAFFAGWRMLTIVIDLVMDSTENKYANVVYERDSDSDSSDSDSDSDFDSDNEDESEKEEEEPVREETKIEEEKEVVEELQEELIEPKEPELIPLPEDWVAPVSRIANMVSKEWIPLIEQVFQSHESVVVQDMLTQIKTFSERVEKTLQTSQ